MRKARTIKLAIPAAAAALLLGMVALIWDEVPNWRPGGAITISAPSLTHSQMPADCPAPDTRIAIFGDSHVSARNLDDMSGGGGLPFGKVLERALGGSAAVTQLGVGGQTARQGEAKWLENPSTELAGDAGIIFIAYGTNDAAPRGWLRSRVPVPIADYKASLARHIGRWDAAGRRVIVVPPPPGGSAAIYQRLSPYREAAAQIAQEMGAQVLDPADAFAGCSARQPLLTYDALHMNAAGHQCLGEWLADQLCKAEP